MSMTLREELKPLTGNRRKFQLLRIVDMGVNTALGLCGVKRGTYNTWLQNGVFVSLYRRRDEFAGSFKQEAIQLLRRDNQLAAVLLESKILARMKEEIASGELSLVKTNLAREVYSKLMTELDIQPKVQSLSWDQRVFNLTAGEPVPRIEEAVNGEFETIGGEESQHTQGRSTSESQQTTDTTEEKAQEG